ncbi:nuclear transport factor 2 family protein [Pseudonocardia sp.]|uniref:nuclear transport factor 2 family protein n=1 Tax=Pseudonocardia sp. TaxID=60912 RepID=UPI003451C76B
MSGKVRRHDPEDALALQQLLADYGHVVDDHDRDRAHEVFAEDFVFDRSALGTWGGARRDRASGR